MFPSPLSELSMTYTPPLSEEKLEMFDEGKNNGKLLSDIFKGGFSEANSDPLVLNVDNSGIFSSLIKFPYFIQALEDDQILYAFFKLSSHFPEYRSGEELFLLCEDLEKLKTSFFKAAIPYQKKGFKFEYKKGSAKNSKVEIFSPEKEKMELRINLIDSSSPFFAKEEISSVFFKEAIRTRKKRTLNGVSLYTLDVPHEMVCRFLSYHSEAPKSIKATEDLSFIKNKKSMEFLTLIKKYSKVDLTEKKLLSLFKKLPIVFDSERLFLFYNPRKRFKYEMLKRIREFDNIQIDCIRSIQIKSFKTLLTSLHGKKREQKSRKYFEKGEGSVLAVELREFWNQTSKSKGKELLELLRNQFNPRDLKGRRTSSHVVDLIDNPKALKEARKTLNLKEIRRLNIKGYESPVWRFGYDFYKIDKIPLDKIYARLIQGRDENGGFKIVLKKIEDTPHYKFVKGDKQDYIDYFNRYGSMGDHAPEAFEHLIEKYQEDYLTPNGKKDIPLLIKDEKGRLLIVDGFHRSVIHKLRGHSSISTFVFSQKAEKGFLPFPK
jgi:hypothetical protein